MQYCNWFSIISSLGKIRSGPCEMKRPVDFSETPFDRGSSRNKNASCRVLSTAKGVVQARVRDNHMICLTGDMLIQQHYSVIIITF